jgi:hypothetical protein
MFAAKVGYFYVISKFSFYFLTLLHSRPKKIGDLIISENKWVWIESYIGWVDLERGACRSAFVF